MNWLLPEYPELSPTRCRRGPGAGVRAPAPLDHFHCRGYQLVMPPTLEYLDSLLTGAGQDLNLKTFKLVDQLSGRTMGVRADITPQAARIDAHLLNHAGSPGYAIAEAWCIRCRPAWWRAASRSNWGRTLRFRGIAADLEIVRLMASALTEIGVPAIRIDLGHVGIFRALAEAAGLSSDDEEAILGLLQKKDVPGLREACAKLPIPIVPPSFPAGTLWRCRHLGPGRGVTARRPGDIRCAGCLDPSGFGAPELPFSLISPTCAATTTTMASSSPPMDRDILRRWPWAGATTARAGLRPLTTGDRLLPRLARSAGRLVPAGATPGAILCPHVERDDAPGGHGGGIAAKERWSSPCPGGNRREAPPL